MSDVQTSSTDALLDQIQADRAMALLVMKSAALIAEGKSVEDVASLLEQDGCPKALAQKIAARGEEVKREEFRKGGMKTLGIGAGMLALGLVITLGTYSAASSGGGHYVITSGLIMVGGWLVLKGLWRSVAG